MDGYRSTEHLAWVLGRSDGAQTEVYRTLGPARRQRFDRGWLEPHHPRYGRDRAHDDDEADAMTYVRDPRVDAYIDPLPAWQQAICQEVRDLVHAADSEIKETIKRTVQPYFVLEGNVVALLSAKDHVTIFLYDGGIVPDPDSIVTGGHGNETGRMIAVHEGEQLNQGAFTAYVKQIIANNRAGGWRKLKRDGRPR